MKTLMIQHLLVFYELLIPLPFSLGLELGFSLKISKTRWAIIFQIHFSLVLCPADYYREEDYDSILELTIGHSLVYVSLMLIPWPIVENSKRREVPDS